MPLRKPLHQIPYDMRRSVVVVAVVAVVVVEVVVDVIIIVVDFSYAGVNVYIIGPYS